MSDSIEVFKRERFIPTDFRPSNVTFKLRWARRYNKIAVAVYQSAEERFATESLENIDND